ncbi:uncharacterized protein CTHT_0048570 [Thermochaetoides thermophila DSM 1495]|uniref:SMP domain-containing protein n=1 Tax=Chaetomium thermophilum (strain DSM 1495 / CBS 144.50 / IMI 039719) TaxID=759272 RepID=G0SB18_CHATD|nr:hypothetical protein CTHT_0048570 [Thermochaetoides thermophila DSM 1495]EGS19398.1 hypothetical protein CTHT_0048570 [Thermochaetoides thermophila DSM 1495]
MGKSKMDAAAAARICKARGEKDPFAQRAAAAAQRNSLGAALSGSENVVGIGGDGSRNAGNVGGSGTTSKALAVGRR